MHSKHLPPIRSQSLSTRFEIATEQAILKQALKLICCT